MPVIDEWKEREDRKVRVREDAKHFSYEVNNGPGWSPSILANFQAVARRLKWALTTPAGQIRREEAARIRRELLADIDHNHDERIVEAGEFLDILDRICPESLDDTVPSASVHLIPGIGPVTVEEPRFHRPGSETREERAARLGTAAQAEEDEELRLVTVEEPEAADPQQRTSSYRAALAGVVALPALMECSLADFGRRLAVTIREEQEKPLPDNALLAVLCDAARLGDEIVRGMEPRPDNLRDALADELEKLVVYVPGQIGDSARAVLRRVGRQA